MELLKQLSDNLIKPKMEMHTNWQWLRNHKLGLVMEWKVESGKFLVCMSDLEKAAKYPEGKAFYQSVIDYMRSADFNPSAEITVDELKKKLAEKPRQVSLKELNNISQY